MEYLNFSWVLEGYLAGAMGPTSRRDLMFFHRQDIRAVLRMEENTISAELWQLYDMYEPVPDFSAPTLEQIDRMARWIEEQIENWERPVVVTCHAGIGVAVAAGIGVAVGGGVGVGSSPPHAASANAATIISIGTSTSLGIFFFPFQLTGSVPSIEALALTEFGAIQTQAGASSSKVSFRVPIVEEKQLLLHTDSKLRPLADELFASMCPDTRSKCLAASSPARSGRSGRSLK